MHHSKSFFTLEYSDVLSLLGKGALIILLYLVLRVCCMTKSGAVLANSGI